MDRLELNGYINAATEALLDDPQYRHLFDDMLVTERIEADKKGFPTNKLEYALNELWCLELDYIMEHRGEIEERLNSTLSDN